MKKFIILLAIILSSCEIQYDGETKLVIKGKVIDANNSPIANKEVKLFVSKDGGQIPLLFYVPSEENFIGQTFTNSSGEYTMVIPKPTGNFTEIIVETNAEDNSLNPKQIRNIQNFNFINYQLNVPISKLFNKTELKNLQLLFNPISGVNQLVDVDFEGDFSNPIEFINPIEEQIPNNFSLTVKRNQNFIVRYKLKNNSTNSISENTEIIIIDNTDFSNYTINY